MRVHLIVLATTLLGATRAQNDDAPPPTPLVHAVVRGPAAWRARFLPTNLGSLLASAQGEAMVRPLLAGLDGLWPGADAREQQVSRARLLAFDGTVQLLIWTIPDRPAPRALGAIALHAGQEGDALALASDVASLLRPRGAERAQAEVAGETVTIVHCPTVAYTEPRRIGDGAVVLVAERKTDLDAAAELWRGFASDGNPLPAPLAPVQVTIDLPQVVRLDRDMAERATAAPAGLLALDRLVLTLATDGPRLMGEAALHFAPGERGYFGGVFPEIAGAPTIGDVVPPTAVGWHAGRCDWRQLWRSMIAVAAAEDGQTTADVRAKFKADCGGIDPGDELVARLRDEGLVLWTTGQSGLGPGAIALVASCSEEKAFRTAFETVLRQDSTWEIDTSPDALHAHLEASWLFPPVHIAVRRGLVALALGHGATALVDQVQAPVNPTPATRVHPIRTPPGCSGAGAVELGFFLDRNPEILLEGVDAVAPVWHLDKSQLVRLVADLHPLLVEHTLTRVTTLTGCADACFRFRVLW